MSNNKVDGRVLQTMEIGTTLETDLLARDASLWLGPGVGEAQDEIAEIAQLAALPWQAVGVESCSAQLSAAIETHKDQSDLVARRGYIDLISVNPEEIRLATRTLPIYLLNGREGSNDPNESSNLRGNRRLLRRLAMLERIQEKTARHLVLVSNGGGDFVDDFAAMWEEGFRARISFVTTDKQEIEKLRRVVAGLRAAPTVTLIEKSPRQFAADLSRWTLESLAPHSIRVRMRSLDKTVKVVDASHCDLSDHPILDRYELLRESILAPLMPDDLTNEEMDAFFRRDGSERVWRAHAASLPWLRDDVGNRQLLNRLRRLHSIGAEGNCAALILAEPGSGGTTLLEQLAFVAASEGYPALVARRASFEPGATELVGFLNRLVKAHSDLDVGGTPNRQETPILLAFDVEHWRGHEEAIGPFVRNLQRSGRSVLSLIVTDIDGLNRTPRDISFQLDVPLSHQLSEDDAVHLGRHLNKFLKPKGKNREESDWLRFYHSQQPAIGDFGATAVSFWIALEFWLRLQLPLGESIQNWVFKQFCDASLSVDLARLVLQVAAMTIERVGMPEELFPTPTDSALPQSTRLQQASDAIPGVGLFRAKTASGSQWMLGHPLLARYLLRAVAQDRTLLKVLGFLDVTDAIQLRLALLRTVATSPQLAMVSHMPLATYFATTILKLDRDGNREFFHEWRSVLGILEGVHSRVWESSRVFNHHVAISRRRIASDEEFFPLTPLEKQEQLTAAAEHLEFALARIEERENDDSTLNLLNSLARCYQDLFALAEGALGDKILAETYRTKATDATRRAFELSPLNSYVLETRAKELIMSATLIATEDPASAASLACDAIDCVQRALSLESSPGRESKLHELLIQAFQLLASQSLSKQLAILSARNDPLGLVGCAWLELRNHLSPGEPLVLADVDDAQIDAALALLQRIPPERRKAIDLRLSYELVVRREPYNYLKQVELIEDIGRTGARADYQTTLELAVLLYQVGRPRDGDELFKNLRVDLRKADSFVTVPDRLRVLRRPDEGKALTCQATFVRVDNYGKHWAKVQELARAEAPFNPYEFGYPHIAAHQRFQCVVTFGPNGPFLRPQLKES